ncbi:MAG TPA: NAD(P)/FAD-dependent oxidoreductase [Oligoflexus sp.]|uniref:NAD(P)/FAD-dependent oxidoreductase n=1 Tax=Oligoflexus sp. TaxID=1971216 RepID=UPI002D63CDD5|nr:NAD(P)/FAD-dependent oxidoreductase [Oligoflexus sp.]HYX38856.1 NAD(P)/FAD-dependent oxidoreductase [Oligoflexus sp.]
MEEFDLIVVGGGAAGYFGAIACAETRPGSRVVILEATPRVLTKVKISGGGRCNVTHHQFETKRLVASYPRGHKELIGAFHRFQPRDTVAWFADHGVELKVEPDGRMFPITDSSQTIIDCLERTAHDNGVEVRLRTLVQRIEKVDEHFLVHTKEGTVLRSRFLLLATGSMPFGQNLARDLGHRLVDPVPSLFTFEIKDPLLEGLSGTSFPRVHIQLKVAEAAQDFQQEGPCLITHWGLSGPAVLKLSAFAARELFASHYKAQVQINWEHPLKFEAALQQLETLRQQYPKKRVSNENPFSCTRRFWEALLRESGVQPAQLYAETGKKNLQDIARRLTGTILTVEGKGVFKEEFVTAGGVSREEIDFRRMESKVCPGLFLSGEVLDVDGITGGFNFQNAWTGSWLAAQAIAQSLNS